jgi:CDP-glucose 4,6-dehydratase
VLEPLGGYLWLAACLANSQLSPPDSQPSTVNLASSSAFNFGPGPESTRTVEELVGEILRHWPGRWEDRGAANAVHEATLLSLSIDKARRLLGWEPVWDFTRTVAATVEWYRTVSQQPVEASRLLQAEITRYTSTANEHKLPWTR